MIKISILKEIIWNDKMTASFQREIGIQLSTIKNMIENVQRNAFRGPFAFLCMSKMKIKHIFQEG